MWIILAAWVVTFPGHSPIDGSATFQAGKFSSEAACKKFVESDIFKAEKAKIVAMAWGPLKGIPGVDVSQFSYTCKAEGQAI